MKQISQSFIRIDLLNQQFESLDRQEVSRLFPQLFEFQSFAKWPSRVHSREEEEEEEEDSSGKNAFHPGSESRQPQFPL